MHNQMRADKYPEEWADFIVEMWLGEECTRKSESAADEIRNPHKRKDLSLAALARKKTKMSCALSMKGEWRDSEQTSDRKTVSPCQTVSR